MNRARGTHVGMYGQLRWSGAGLKPIWDAAGRRRGVDGGDEEFVRRIGANTDWPRFIDEDATNSPRRPAG